MTYMDGVFTWLFFSSIAFIVAVVNYSIERDYSYNNKQAQWFLRSATVAVPLAIFWPLGLIIMACVGLFFAGKGLVTLGRWLVE